LCKDYNTRACDERRVGDRARAGTIFLGGPPLVKAATGEEVTAEELARRPDAIFIARTRPDGTLVPAGSAELGLSSDERDQLRTALAQRHLESRRGSHRVRGGIWVEIDYHGDRRGLPRDALMRAVRIEA
jgi:hypothetical protein